MSVDGMTSGTAEDETGTMTESGWENEGTPELQ